MAARTRILVPMLFVLMQPGAPVAPAHLGAQESGSTPIFLVLPDVYPDVDGRVLLLREPGREIVVLAPSATAEDLSVALDMLERFRRERGAPEGGRGHMIPIVGYAPAPGVSEDRRARLDAALIELRARPVAQVGNLGAGRWMRWGQ